MRLNGRIPQVTEMSDQEWIESLRNRTHDLATAIQSQESRILILEERERAAQERLDRVGGRVDQIDQQVRSAEHDLITLKIKAGVWGLAGGLLPAIGALLLVMK